MTKNSQTKIKHLFFWGQLLSPLYSFIMAQRRRLYENDSLKRHKLEVPVISVGNLVLGGTGKTPLVLYIAEILQKLGKRPAILSRGYKGTASGFINIVSDGKTILMDAEKAGDEPRLLAEKLPGVPVITGKKRSLTGRYAIDTFGADCLILDDGFQHISLKRDLDLVLFNAEKLLENGRVLPGGFLREPTTALKSADGFIISGVERTAAGRIVKFTKYLNELFPETPVFTGRYLPDEKIGRLLSGSNDTIRMSECREMPVYGFCGIARPESFYDLLKRINLNLVGFESFADHFAYTPDNINSLCEKALSCGAEALITTEKDLVKIRHLFPKNIPLLTLGVVFQMDKGFDQFIRNRLMGSRLNG